jgi:RNA polymerase sigma factor (sigma-70 family)
MKTVERKYLERPARPVPPENTNARDPDAFVDQLVTLRRALYQRGLFLEQDRTAAEDLTQETIERALQARHRFHVGSNLGAWVFSIMRNLFIDRRRRRAMHARLEERAYWLFGRAPGSAAHDDVDARDEEAAERCDLSRCVQPPDEDGAGSPLEVISTEDVTLAVATLAPAQREIFTLAYGQHLPYREIANRLGIPVSTAGTRLLRARAKVRARLELVMEERWRDYAAGRCGRA